MNTLIILFGKISSEIERYAESSTLKKIAADSSKVLFAYSSAYAWAFPGETWSTAYSIMSSFHFFWVKFAFLLLLAFVVFPMIVKLYHGEDNTGIVEGVPVSELVDHIFLHGSFRRDDIESKFAIPRNRYQTLANRLDTHGIFDRGDNNKRVLRDGVKREEIVDALRGSTIATVSTPLSARMHAVFRYFRNWLYNAWKPGGKPNGNDPANDTETEWKRTPLH